jgi:malate dehydrogenase (oxaloacetate-decarboxylating)(NADP+)
MENKNEALSYHQLPVPGKIKVVPIKPCATAKHLSLAYSPGVADPCLEIQKNPDDAYIYTAKNNLVGVISNGTAVLGLGNIGALAGKPVMEGKGVLFKRFANVNVFDIEVNETNPDKFIEIVKSLEPTFGGINLEDIKAPECFYIEKELIKALDIPVFHDDQHGTAVITAAALQNALEIQNKNIEDIKIVVSGAGAAAMACANLIIHMGAKRENIFMFDSKGLLTQERKDSINEYKQEFMQPTKKTIQEALTGADVFIGVSKGNLLTKEDIKLMDENPTVFAMANPTPEISYEDAKEANPNTIMGTGRSDYPNQVNNVLGFPFIFRGALDTRAKKINIEMKLAAVKALAELAKLEMPQEIEQAYGKKFEFGKDYIIPKPFDKRVLSHVAPAIAKAAIDSGVARITNIDFEKYKKDLEKMADDLSQGIYK